MAELGIPTFFHGLKLKTWGFCLSLQQWLCGSLCQPNCWLPPARPSSHLLLRACALTRASASPPAKRCLFPPCGSALVSPVPAVAGGVGWHSEKQRTGGQEQPALACKAWMVTGYWAAVSALPWTVALYCLFNLLHLTCFSPGTWLYAWCLHVQ